MEHKSIRSALKAVALMTLGLVLMLAASTANAQGIRPWTSAGSTGTVDEDSQTLVSLNAFAVSHANGQSGSVHVRYNISATDNVSFFCPATQSVVKVRFRNSDNSGTTARLTFEIHSTNIATGGNTIDFSFNSDGIGAGNAYTSATFTPALDFDFANRIYWVEATLFRSDTIQLVGLGSIQIYENAGAACP
jgi:hypothetical protein